MVKRAMRSGAWTAGIRLIIYFSSATIVTLCAAVGAYTLAMSTESIEEEWSMVCAATIIAVAIFQHHVAIHFYSKEKKNPN